MKLHQSVTLANLELFEIKNTPAQLMRFPNDIFLLWKICEFYQPSSVLEIGFYSGQSLGFMIESTGPNTKYTSVEIDYTHKNVFDQLFHNDPKFKNIEFLEIDSRTLALDRQYDFIHIDGDHSYEFAANDIQKCLPILHSDSILCIDDYYHAGVDQAIVENLLGQNNFVPFLAGDQEMFFHHKSHSADVFLDEWIQEGSSNFIDFSNYDYYGFTVLRARTPNIFVDHINMFYQAVQLYNL